MTRRLDTRRLVVSGKTPDTMKPKRRVLKLPGGVLLDLVLCRAGHFCMGSADDELGRDTDEQRHVVSIRRDFWIGRFPITQSQWECVMGGNPSRIKGGDLPIVNVSFADCLAFAKTVGEMVGAEIGLPKESEWEYACRAGTETAYCWGDSADGGDMPCCLSPVTSCWRNSWGISGMHGNVFEWCDDWYDANYRLEAVGGECLDVERYRVVRGGSWTSNPQDCRSAFRGREEPMSRSHEIGFRICMTAFY